MYKKRSTKYHELEKSKNIFDLAEQRNKLVILILYVHYIILIIFRV